jgi:hypothetical protein
MLKHGGAIICGQPSMKQIYVIMTNHLVKWQEKYTQNFANNSDVLYDFI